MPQPGHVVAVLTDLTEIKRNEEALQEANRALETARDEAIRASRLKSEFLATLSHEIRTPMNGILGMAELLLDTPLSRTQRDYAGVIYQSGEALMEIINGILDFSRLEAGRMQLQPTRVPVGPALEQVVELMSATARSKSLDIRWRVEPGCPAEVEADAGRLRQVLLNLVGNAVKFTDAGSVDVRALRSASGRVRFEIADTGVGISPQFRDRLFMPFSQGDASSTRRHGGTGLGLAISKSLVELMGGEIGVASDGACGATFWFELPG
jgi:signal transduction histidine kinase